MFYAQGRDRGRAAPSARSVPGRVAECRWDPGAGLAVIRLTHSHLVPGVRLQAADPGPFRDAPLPSETGPHKQQRAPQSWSLETASPAVFSCPLCASGRGWGAHGGAAGGRGLEGPQGVPEHALAVPPSLYRGLSPTCTRVERIAPWTPRASPSSQLTDTLVSLGH